MRLDRRAAALWLVFTLVGCKYDVDLPPRPTAGSVSGVLDLGGRGALGDRELELFAEDGSSRTTRTRDTGGFVFGDVAPGLYFLDVSVPGFVPLVRPNVRVLNGAAVDLGTLTLTWAPSDSTVKGKVTVPGRGNPVGGRVDLVLEALGEKVGSAALDEEGGFVARVPPGVYTLRALHPLYVSATLTGLDVPSAGSVDVSDQPLVLALNPARLSGTLLKERDGQSAVPAAGATVTLDTGDTTVADVDGRFLLTGLPAGQHTVRFALTDWHDPASPHAVTLSPGAATDLDPVTLALDRGAIAGTVELADGQPATDVTVSLTGTTASVTAVPLAATPSQAGFRLGDVPVGVYELVAHKQGYQPGVVGSVRVTAQQTTTPNPIALVAQSGAFVIDDGDALSTPGFVRQPAVTLQLTSTTAAKFRASHDSSFSGVAFAPLTGPNQPFTLSPGEGTKVVYVQFQDGAGVDGPVLQSSVIYDATPPASTSLQLNGGEAFTRVAQPLFATLQALDLPPTGVDAASGLKSVRLTENGTPDGQGLLQVTPQPYQRDVVFVRPSSAEGVQRVFAQFFDHAGNASAIVPAEITIDVTLPAGSLTIAPGTRATLPGFTNQPLVELQQQQSSTEPDGGFVLIKLGNTQAELNSAVYQPLRATSGWFIDSSADGTKSVLAVLRDAAGNTSGTLSASIVYDTTPPSPVALTLVGAAVTRAASVTLEASASDSNPLSPTQALTVSEDPLFVSAGQVGPQALNPQPASISFPLSGDGVHRVFARFRDAAGNDATAQVTVTRDTEPPAGSLVVRGTLADGTPSTSVTSTATVAVQLTTSGGATEYLLGDDTLAACPTGGYFPLPANGLVSGHPLTGTATPREVRLCLRDAAGNPFGPVTATIALDVAAPSGCQLALTGARADGQATPPLPAGKTGSPFVSAAVSGCGETPTELVLSTTPITCSASAALPWRPYTASSVVTLSQGDGLNTVFGCVRDAARNTASVTSAALTLDTTPPRVTSFVLHGGATYFNLADSQAVGGTLDVAALGAATGASEWSVSESAAFTTFVPFVAGTPVTVRLGGSGARTVSALFRDDVGNEAPVVSDGLVVDIAVPLGGTVSVLSPTGNGFTNSVSVTAALTAPADATVVQLAPAAGSTCAVSDFTGAISRTMAPTFGFVLPAGDGVRHVCARLFDAAGNAGAPLQGSITLDTTPPTAPQLVTAAQVVSSPDGTPLVVTTTGPVTEANFDHYQRLGGLHGGQPLNTWLNDAASIGTTSFTFTLQSSATVEEVPNVLRLRARDLAGNVSPEATVVITTDIRPPSPVELNHLWVRNASERGTVFWRKSGSTDVVAYNVYYAPSTQQASGYALSGYRGTVALQGRSPVRVDDVNAAAATLSGLSNGSGTFVTVRPVDRAGNEGPAPSTGPVEVQLQPNFVSPDLLGTLTTGMAHVSRLQLYGHFAYAWGLGPADATSVLQPIDLTAIDSPVQFNTLTTTPTLPTLLAAQSFPDNAGAIAGASQALDLAIDGQYLFAASGRFVRIFSLRNPRAPAVVATIDVSSLSDAAFSVAVKGNTLFVGGRSADEHALLMAFDLAKLYDNDAATVPALADLLGAVQGAWSDAIVSIALTREWAITTTRLGGTGVFYFVTGALDGPGGAPFNNSAYSGMGERLLGTLPTRNVTSGNLFINFGAGQTGLFTVNNLWNMQGWPWTAPSGTVTAGNMSQSSASGSQLFLGDPTVLGLRVLDFSALPTVEDRGVFRSPTTGLPGAMLTYGNYLLVAVESGINVVEVARPSGLHSVGSAPVGGPQSELAPGLLFSGNGEVLDLTSGNPPVALNPGSGVCSTDLARVGDVVISGYQQYRVMNMEDAIDRDGTAALTVWDFDDRMDFTPTSTAVSGLDSAGHVVVAAEVRTSGATGVWLRVIDGRKLLRRATWASWSPLGTDVLGELRVSAHATASTVAHLSMHLGRALVTLEDPGGVVGNTFFVVDLRPLLDDDATTTLSAPVNVIQAQLNLGNLNGGVIRGDYAYLAAASSGLQVVAIPEAMDELPATTVPSSTPTASLPLVGGAEAVTAYGSFAYVTPTFSPAQNKGLQVIDIRAPLAPTVFSYLPMSGPLGQCGARGSIHVSGSRAYLTGSFRTEIFELE